MNKLFGLALLASTVRGLTLTYCSTLNIGSDLTTSDYMSNGLCKTTCLAAGYSVAIVQDTNCWCSDDVPSSTVDTSNCDTSCPGYPLEMCASDGYYGYLVIGTVSGTSTVGASSTALSSSSSSSRSSSSSSSANTRTSSSSSSSSTGSSDSSSDAASSSALSSSDGNSDSTSESSSQSTTASIRATTIYKTVSGSQQKTTEYITETPSLTSNSSATGTSGSSSSSGSSSQADSSSTGSSSTASSSNKNSFFDSTGKVAGTFTVVGLVAAALIGALLYFWCCAGCCGFGGRYHNNSDEENGYASDDASFTNKHGGIVVPMPPTSGAPHTGTNNHSPGANVGNNTNTNSNKALTRDNSNKSVFSFFASNGAGAAIGRNSSKKRLLAKENNGNNNSNSDRNFNSTILVDEMNQHLASNSFGENDIMIPIAELDHRLEPGAVFLATNESKNSLGDENDYSRRILTVTNPE